MDILLTIVWGFVALIYTFYESATNAPCDSAHLLPLQVWTAFFAGILATKLFKIFR